MGPNIWAEGFGFQIRDNESRIRRPIPQTKRNEPQAQKDNTGSLAAQDKPAAETDKNNDAGGVAKQPPEEAVPGPAKRPRWSEDDVDDVDDVETVGATQGSPCDSSQETLP